MRTKFRVEAQESQRTSALGEILLVRPMTFTLLSSGAACMAIAVILLFIFGSYARRTTVSGIVVPDSGVVKVYAPQSGVVLRKAVVEGQHVTRGMVLYTVSLDLQSAAQGHTQVALIDEARRRKQSLLREIDKTRLLQQDERDTLQAKLGSQRAELAGLDDQLASQRERVALATDAVMRYKRLLEQDYISTDQFQQRQADLLDQRSKLQGLQRDRSNLSQILKETTNALGGLALKQQNQVGQIDRNVMEVDQTLIESEARREFVVTAAESGIAATVIAEPGQTVDTAHPVASIVPDGSHWQAYLFVPNGAIGFVHIGDRVQMRYQAYPFQKFGQYHGRITSISRTALSAADLQNGGDLATDPNGHVTYYRATVALDAQTVTVHGMSEPLQAGMALQADILQERRKLYEWVLEPLYSVTGKL
ncbi:HlyD family secretion protein [Burkholderia thailandensis]|uniref:HlyD family secretion protein n=1 Tax=Burkholderia TaxID=32008 RepID=UPI00211B5366|nr:HlyD family secretion protein [Burkholderia sp. AU28863]